MLGVSLHSESGFMLSQTEAQQSIIITGGNSGLGYQCAKEIARSGGWHIIIASRNLHRVEIFALVTSNPQISQL
jgi:NAD(P)-dependent dehydrogenase (short-subunit alcohol dehydrogenase family)